MPKPEFCVFEYVYRDASNYKAWGRILLNGGADTKLIETLRSTLESAEFFIPEQVGLLPLQTQLWTACGCTPDDKLDHCWHEFSEVREATANDLADLVLWGSLDDLLRAFCKVKEWDVRESCPSTNQLAVTPSPTPTTPASPH